MSPSFEIGDYIKCKEANIGDYSNKAVTCHSIRLVKEKFELENKKI